MALPAAGMSVQIAAQALPMLLVSPCTSMALFPTIPPGQDGSPSIHRCGPAGYDDQKRQIEDTLLLALQHPEIYDDIAKRTRKSYASNKPRFVRILTIP